jgi:ATP-dependent RNA helicase DHX57
LQEAGLIPSTSSTDIAKSSKSSSNDSLVRALVASALYPNIARIIMPATKYEKLSSGSLALDPEARAIKLFTASDTPDNRDERVFIHPGSTLFSATSFVDNCLFAAFFTRVQTSKVFLRDVTPVGALAVLLLCGDEIEIDHLGRGVQVRELRMKAWARIGTLIAILRRLLDERLRWKIERPEIDILEDDVIICLQKLIQS